MAKQMEEKMQRLSIYGVTITGLYTDDGLDQVSNLLYLYYFRSGIN